MNPKTRGHLSAEAFTLVELLVVMGIIGLLAMLLMPSINSAIQASRVAATSALIGKIEAGIYSFKQDWRVFPPSDKVHEKLQGMKSEGYGYQNVALALLGPNGRGWGAVENNVAPFGGSDTRLIRPYVEQETGAVTDRFADAFKSPDRNIFYYRFEPNEASSVTGLSGNFDDTDNPPGASDLGKGFAIRTQFLLAVSYTAPDLTKRWRRQDFMLISPGPDRYYGHVKEGDPPQAATTAAAGVTNDDVTNFNQ